jgi:hypothetical protein
MFLMDHFVLIVHQWTTQRFHINSSHFRICVKTRIWDKVAKLFKWKLVRYLTFPYYIFISFKNCKYFIQKILIYIERYLKKTVTQKCSQEFCLCKSVHLAGWPQTTSLFPEIMIGTVPFHSKQIYMKTWFIEVLRKKSKKFKQKRKCSKNIKRHSQLSLFSVKQKLGAGDTAPHW